MFQDYLQKHRETITQNDPNNGICYDGIVDQSRYFSKDKRLLFLLKETNGNKNNGQPNEKQNDWDYMAWVRKQAKQDPDAPLYRSVFRNIAMWSRMFEIMTEEDRIPTCDEFVDANGLIINKALCESLLGIGIVNLKKSWGVGQTDWNALKQYLEGEQLRQEILLYQLETLKPSVVLCGGTFDFAKMVFGKDVEILKVTDGNGKSVEYFIQGETTFVNCYHPSRPGWSRSDSFAYMNHILGTVLK